MNTKSSPEKIRLNFFYSLTILSHTVQVSSSRDNLGRGKVNMLAHQPNWFLHEKRFMIPFFTG